jgi:alkanesulfonate monooxygenase SsuD/methylene tetrahydromethanopterin reductase-like flavin-dependent oxidoreductase (luciferase family)
MKLGYLIDTNVAPYDGPIPDRDVIADSMQRFLEEGIAAEEAGFDSVNVPERHMRTECHFPTPFQLLTALAVRTSKIRLATHSLVLTLYHPMQAAEQAAVLDNLSRGRVILTVAMGYHPAYWQMLGMTSAKRKGRFVEEVEILRLAFAGKPFSYQGDHYQLENVMLTPQAYQQPSLPIWMGGHFEPAIERAGQYGDAWCGDPFPIDKETWRRRMDLYRESAARSGRTAYVAIMREAWVAPTSEQAAAAFGNHFVTEQLFYYKHGLWPKHPDFRAESDVTLKNLWPHIIVGSPEECVEKLGRYAEEFEVDYCVLRFRMPTGPSFQETKESIQLFGEQVIPSF